MLSAIGLPPLTTSRVIALSCNTNNIKRHRGSCRAAFISFDLMLFHFALYIWSDVTAKANNLDSLCVSLFFFSLPFTLMCSLPPDRFLLHFSTFDKEIRSPLERHLSRVYRIVFLEFLQQNKFINKERKKKAGHLLIVIAVVVVVPVVVAVVVTSFPCHIYLFYFFLFFSLPFKFKLSRAKDSRPVES